MPWRPASRFRRVHYEQFVEAFDREVRIRLPSAALEARIETDGELESHDINPGITPNCKSPRGGPWGQAFPEPMFHGEFDIVSQRVVGEVHLRLVLKAGDRSWWTPSLFSSRRLTALGRLLAVYRLDVNDYGDLPTVQLRLEHVQALPCCKRTPWPRRSRLTGHCALTKSVAPDETRALTTSVTLAETGVLAMLAPHVETGACAGRRLFAAITKTCGICVFVLAIGLFATGGVAETGTVEEIVVTAKTGSRIGRQGDSPSPLSNYDAAVLLDAGLKDIRDLVGVLAINAGAENNSDNLTQNYTVGTANMNLRGLGVASTLVLLNGRRQVLSAVQTDDGSSFVDLAALVPMLAIERVEILKDGAAAIYGSEAVAGVANFITRQGFQGMEFQASIAVAAATVPRTTSASMAYSAARSATATVLAARVSSCWPPAISTARASC